MGAYSPAPVVTPELLPVIREQVFDRVILACHGDQALRLLADPTPDERRLLGEFRCQPNTATVHTDESVMPRARLAWSSWNYELNRDAAGRPSTATTPPPSSAKRSTANVMSSSLMPATSSRNSGYFPKNSLRR